MSIRAYPAGTPSLRGCRKRLQHSRNGQVILLQYTPYNKHSRFRRCPQPGCPLLARLRAGTHSLFRNQERSWCPRRCMGVSRSGLRPSRSSAHPSTPANPQQHPRSRPTLSTQPNGSHWSQQPCRKVPLPPEVATGCHALLPAQAFGARVIRQKGRHRPFISQTSPTPFGSQGRI